MRLDEAQFEAAVLVEDCARFAEVSGDWNPLHTDPEHAAASVYGSQVLHGAFSAGLISRLAGMHLPGEDCLLYGMRLRFVTPIIPPASLVVFGKITAASPEGGRVEAKITDADSGALYVDASYEFGYHRMAGSAVAPPKLAEGVSDVPVVLVTGASGGLGSALVRRLGARARPAPRNSLSGRINVEELSSKTHLGRDGRIAAIVHCAWPTPDNRRLIDLDDAGRSIEHNVAGPLRDIQALATLISDRGTDNSPLILVGSTFAKAGRHYFRMPLYSIAKSTIPTVVEILALELASRRRRCVGVVFDVLDGGMNKGMTESAKLSNADRSPWGGLATPDQAAEQIVWLLENESEFLSGATLTLTAGSIP
jgi:NAD(P)-dependent dehydrogenase (short-subunit alcohol dehydrogenase family)/acyl dehydratase